MDAAFSFQGKKGVLLRPNVAKEPGELKFYKHLVNETHLFGIGTFGIVMQALRLKR